MMNALGTMRAGGVRQSRDLKHTGHNQARARRGPFAPGPQIVGQEQAARRQPVVTTAGSGPEPHPLRPTLNSSPLPAPSWCCRRGSSRRPDRRARATWEADSGTTSPARATGPVRRRHAAIRRRAARVPCLPYGGPGIVHPI